MIQEVTPELKELFVQTANVLKGSERRLFMARTVKALGRGGQSYAETELGWNRGTIQKGQKELTTGQVYVDNFTARGRKKCEEHLPNLLTDIREIVDSQSQTDPTFQTTRRYTRLSAQEVRQQLLKQKGYTEAELPSNATLSTKLNELGYRLKPVQKSQPKKKRPKQTPSSPS
jgi:hypothetical protein